MKLQYLIIIILYFMSVFNDHDTKFSHRRSQEFPGIPIKYCTDNGQKYSEISIFQQTKKFPNICDHCLYLVDYLTYGRNGAQYV
jgi:hypothetical protein